MRSSQFININNMEYEKILFSRLIYSFIWSVALHIFPLSLYIFITNFDVLHPLDWLVKSVLIVFNVGTWFSLIPLHGLVFGIGYVLAQEHKKPPCLTTSRFQHLATLFNRYNILRCFLYICLGITAPWSLLRLNNISLTQQCLDSAEKLCLNETSIFLMACGVWTGIYYFLRFDVLTDKRLQFPIVRQVRFLHIRSKFPVTFWNCFKLSFVPLFYFLPFYLWYGKQVTSIFEVILSANLETAVLIRVAGLFKISLLIHAWLISSLYFTLVEVLQLMIQIHYTEHYSFPLIKQPNTNSILLSCALGEQCMPIIQHLACYDLYIMSMSKKCNRWQVFTLSQPGGHPHTWNAILHESLKLIDKFIMEIEDVYKCPEPLKERPPEPRHYHSRDMTTRHEEIFRSSVPLSQANKLRNLVDFPSRSAVREQPSAVEEIWMKIESFNTVIQQNSIYCYFFASKPDAKIRYLVSNSQPLIWVIQSISELSANALMEDQFGIVLKDLPLIINTLLRLKCSVDRLGNIQKKFQKRDHDVCMKTSLKSALRRSLYRIAIAYSEYLTDLPLPIENHNRMQSFVYFKEC